MATITITGLDRLYRRLDATRATGALVPPMQRAVLRVANRMANYPAPPPRSTYRRTGTLGRRWTVKVIRTANGVQGRVGNNTIYAPLVQSRRFQTRVHRGRWQTAEDVVEQLESTITADFQAAVNRAIEGR